jgi:protein CpxP
MKALRVSGLVGAVSVLAVAVVTSVALFAQPGPGGPGFGRHEFARGGPGVGLPLRELELTEAQHAQVRGIFEQRKAELDAVGQRLHAAHDAQHQAVTRIPVDENEIRARVTEASAVEAEAAILHARIHEAVFQVLTPEQQTKARTLEADRQKRMAERQQQFQQRLQQRQQDKAQQAPPQ